MDKLEFIYKRHSIRKFKDIDVPNEDIKEIIKAATHAPSGKHLQNWHFTVVKNRDKILEMADLVENKHHELVNQVKNEEVKNNFSKYLKYQTIFKYAPAVVLVFSGPYPTTGLELLKDIGASSEEIHDLLKPSPGVQNIGAAIENLLLAASNMGYGGCWITSANFASKELKDYIGLNKDGYFLAALVTLGVPENPETKSPKRKPLEDVLTILE